MHYITKGVRHITKPPYLMQVALFDGRAFLVAQEKRGSDSKMLKISKKVAEVLIAFGLSWEG